MGKEAQDKRGLDMLSGSLWKSIPAFALPVAATGILEQMSSLIDTMMVGHLSGDAGPAAMAAPVTRGPPRWRPSGQTRPSRACC